MSEMRKQYEGILQDLRDKGVPDDLIETLERASHTTLFLRAEAAEETRASIAALTAEIAQTKNGMKAEAALSRAGVDVEALRPAEKRVVSERFPEDGELAEEWAAGLVAEFALPTKKARQ